MNSKTSAASSEEISDAATRLKRDAEAAAAAAQRTGKRVADDVREQGEDALSGVSELIARMETEGRARVREMADAAEGYVQTRPLQAIGIAAGVGLIAGFLLARR